MTTAQIAGEAGKLDRVGEGLQVTKNREWAEPLPEGCPPPEAWKPEDEIYYRLVDDSDNPNPRDFFSVRKLKPNRNFVGVSECETLGLSVFDTLDACRGAGKLRGLRHKRVAKVALSPERGVILQTRGPAHHSWWLEANFDPVSICEPV